MTMTKPSPGTTVLKDGWFYLNTYLENRPTDPNPDGCSLLIKHVQQRQGKSGRVWAEVHTDALQFASTDAMVTWIEDHAAQELPKEADGDPGYIPEGYR